MFSDNGKKSELMAEIAAIQDPLLREIMEEDALKAEIYENQVMKECQLMDAVEWADARALETKDAALIAQETAEDEVKETIQLIHVLDELTEEQENLLMRRILWDQPHQAFEILSAALDRAVKAQVTELLKVKE
jgi:hypothetical protein